MRTVSSRKIQGAPRKTRPKGREVRRAGKYLLVGKCLNRGPKWCWTQATTEGEGDRKSAERDIQVTLVAMALCVRHLDSLGDAGGLWGCSTGQSQQQCWQMTTSAMPFKAKVAQITASEMPNFGMNGVKQVAMSKEISKQFFIRFGMGTFRLLSKMGICEKEVQKEAKG